MIFLYVKVDFHDTKVGDDLIAHPGLTHTRRRQSQSETAACPMDPEIKSPRPPFPKGGIQKASGASVYSKPVCWRFFSTPLSGNGTWLK
jgi:hypothetical protein